MMGSDSLVILLSIGAVMACFAGLAAIGNMLQVAAQPNKAFVRTSGLAANSNAMVCRDGKTWVISPIHKIRWVDLQTVSVQVEFEGTRAMLTGDPNYADIRATLFLRVGQTESDIVTAARTIAGEIVDATAIRQLVEPKFEGVLRMTAATFELMVLHSEHDNFIKQIHTRLTRSLAQNGLTVESISICSLKASELGTFSPNNVFGAMVAVNQAKVINIACIEQNKIEQAKQIEIKEHDCEFRIKLNEVEQEKQVAIKQAEVALRKQPFQNEAEMPKPADKSADSVEAESYPEQANPNQEEKTDDKTEDKIALRRQTVQARIERNKLERAQKITVRRDGEETPSSENT